MRYSKVILIFVVTALVTACSQNDEPAAMQRSIPDEGPEQIHLSMGMNNTLVTRASIESDDDGIFELQDIGMFMLAKHKMSVNPEEANINWITSVNPFAVWFDNMPARAVINTADDNTRSVSLLLRSPETGNDTILWYPIGSWYSYRFYGYYPIQPTYTESANRRIVTFTGLDGTKDIIWGRSATKDYTDAHEQYAYSARYFRQVGYAEAYPQVNFEHKMMRFQFAIQGVADPNAPEGEEYLSANKMTLDTIVVEQVPSKADLIIADLNDDDVSNTNDGKITYDWKNDLVDVGVLSRPLIDKELIESGQMDGPYVPDGEFVKKQIHNDSIIYVGQPMLLPVPDADAAEAGKTVYRVNVRLLYEDGTEFDHEKPIDLNIDPLRDVSTTYRPGMSYLILLRIAGPKQVNMKATLSSWKDVDVHRPLEFD